MPDLRPPGDQLDLFGGEPVTSGGGVAPAAVDDDTRALAGRLPPEVHLGTSSWSFPGWAGLVYGEPASEAVLARRGLPAYAAHPLFATVGVDRTFYAPVETEVMAGYAAAVPPRFRFLVKAHEALTMARFPNHARYGAQRGQDNPRLFDVAWATDQVVAPYVDGLGDKGGVLLFQFPPQPAELFGGPRRFAERLYRFLRDLPPGPRYAVEVRTPDLMGRDLAACLRTVGAAPCVAVMPGLPAADVQWRALGGPDADLLVVRWLLADHHDYESAKAAFTPFARLASPDRRTRSTLANLVRAATARGTASFVIANNKAEGSSPLTLVELAREILDPLSQAEVPPPPGSEDDPMPVVDDDAVPF